MHTRWLFRSLLTSTRVLPGSKRIKGWANLEWTGFGLRDLGKHFKNVSKMFTNPKCPSLNHRHGIDGIPIKPWSRR
jgi:hypothetical protein